MKKLVFSIFQLHTTLHTEKMDCMLLWLECIFIFVHALIVIFVKLRSVNSSHFKLQYVHGYVDMQCHGLMMPQ